MARCRHYGNNVSPPSPPSVNGGAPSLLHYGGGHDDDDLIDGGGSSDRPAKRPRAEDHDCISKMPDDVLIGIVSRLTIRDAVATGAVSARWRDLWKQVPRISLRPRHILPPGGEGDAAAAAAAGALSRDARRLAGAASSVLRQHHGAGVDRLVLALPLAPSVHAAVLDQAMEFAASAGTKELHLSLANGEHPAAGGPPPYDFPHWRFAAAGRLRSLLLCDVSLAAAAPAAQRSFEGLARLTRLGLTRVAVDDAGVASVLSACAALTVLELSKCRQLVHVAASHDGLLVLRVRSCGGLKSVAVASSTLLELAYTGHKVDIVCRRTPAMVRLVLYVTNGCPLDCVATGGGGAALPNLRQLFLQFPSPLHALQHGWRFEGLNKIVLLFKTPWREHVASVASLLAAAPLVKELRVEAYSHLPVPPPNKQGIQWPNRCLPKKLKSIVIGGFSGEPELMELVDFLLWRSPAMRRLTIDTHRRHAVPSNGVRCWRREETEDTERCYYARGVLWTHLAPKIPSTVKFTII
ncbi:hypothetical protein SEVIR_2G035900v4 [Setaria viridis]|nr:uncharacterized protein LOC117843186 [Setaria viridis]